MDILNYILDNAFILIPVLLILGQMMKGIQKIPDKWIPLILLPIGIAGALGIMLPAGSSIMEAAVQGILVTGAAVYGNQIVKQLKKES